MRIFWDHAVRPVLDAAGPRVLVEVGVQAGATTARLLEWVTENGGVVHAIDPRPEIDIASWEDRWGRSLIFHRKRSLDVLGSVDGVDAVLLDGDHNWYTINSELELLASLARQEKRPLPVIFAHDVDWPYARRDMYYDPSSIPEEFRHQGGHGGVHPDYSNLQEVGINPQLYNAGHEGGARNGVLTGIEDFVNGYPFPCEMVKVPGGGGLAILVDHRRLAEAPELRYALERLGSPEVLHRHIGLLEDLRVRTEIRLRSAQSENEQLVRRVGTLKQRVIAADSTLRRCRERLGGLQSAGAAAIANELGEWAHSARIIERSRTWRLGSLAARTARLATFRRPVPSNGPGELARDIEAVLQRAASGDGRKTPG